MKHSKTKIIWLSIGWIVLTLVVTYLAEFCHCASFDYFSGTRTVSHLFNIQSVFYSNVILSSAIAVEFYFHVKWIVPEKKFRKSDMDTILMLGLALILACIQYGWLKSSVEKDVQKLDPQIVTATYAMWAIGINIALTFYARRRIIG